MTRRKRRERPSQNEPESIPPESKRMSRRAFLAWLTAGAAAAGGAGALAKWLWGKPGSQEAAAEQRVEAPKQTAEVPKVTFQDAVEIKSKRGEYIARLKEELRSPYASGLVYDPTGQKALQYIELKRRQGVIDETEVARFKKAYAGSDGVAFMVILTAELGKKVKAPIFVRDGFFSYPNEKSARELIMFHEFRHAQDMHDGIDFGGGLRIDSSNHLMFQPETIGCIWELRGNEGVCVGTLEQQRPGNYTWSFNNAAREIAANYKKLVATMPKTDVEAKVVEAVKAQYRGLTGEQ